MCVDRPVRLRVLSPGSALSSPPPFVRPGRAVVRGEIRFWIWIMAGPTGAAEGPVAGVSPVVASAIRAPGPGGRPRGNSILDLDYVRGPGGVAEGPVSGVSPVVASAIRAPGPGGRPRGNSVLDLDYVRGPGGVAEGPVSGVSPVVASAIRAPGPGGRLHGKRGSDSELWRAQAVWLRVLFRRRLRGGAPDNSNFDAKLNVIRVRTNSSYPGLVLAKRHFNALY